MAGTPKGVKKCDWFYILSCIANIVGFGIMITLYGHHTFVLLPIYYSSEDESYYFKMTIEYILICLSLYVIVYNYIKAMITEPGYCHKYPERKLTKEGLQNLIKRSRNANEYKMYMESDKYNENIEDDLSKPMNEFKDNFGFSIYCDKCERYRYPRTHHCSVCNDCIYNMDHHCTWLNNCVGYHNHRYFLTLLFGCGISCFYYCMYLFPIYASSMIKCWGFITPHYILYLPWDEYIHVCCYNCGIAVTVLCGAHFVKISNDISRGSTTLERKRDYYDGTYYLDFDKHWEMYYGKTRFPFQWLLSPWLEKQPPYEEAMKELYGFTVEQ